MPDRAPAAKASARVLPLPISQSYLTKSLMIAEENRSCRDPAAIVTARKCEACFAINLRRRGLAGHAWQAVRF
jgi:hypothetical protein